MYLEWRIVIVKMCVKFQQEKFKDCMSGMEYMAARNGLPTE